MTYFEKFSDLHSPEDAGIKKLHKFLERSGFTEIIADSEQFKGWLIQLPFSEFQHHLSRINGVIREIPIRNRETDGKNVIIGNKDMDIAFLPPHQDDKEMLLGMMFEKVKSMDNVEDQGLLLYLTIQYLHLFNDGNGRLGRLLYYLTSKAQESTPIEIEEIRGLIVHDGNSDKGRNLFDKEIRPASIISNLVNQTAVSDILSKNFVKQNRRPFSTHLMAGRVDIENKNIDPNLKKHLEKVVSEADGGKFSFRDLTMVKFLEEHNLLEEYESPLADDGMDERTKELQKTIYRFDANRLLSSLSQTDAEEMLRISRDIKRKFVEKLIEIISEPDKYRINDEKTVKDLFYGKNRV